MREIHTPNLDGIGFDATPGSITTDSPKWAREGLGTVAHNITLTLDGREMTFPFFSGPACGDPTLADVIECLASDASLAQDRDELFAICENAEQYEATIKQATEFREFLGDRFDAIVYGE